MRVAEGTGIPVDEGMADVSAGLRADLGLDRYHGAANTPLDRVSATSFTAVEDLWRHGS